MSRIWSFLLILLPFLPAESQINSRDFQQPYYEEDEASSEFSSSNARGPEFFATSPAQDLNVSAVLPDYPWIKVSKFRGFDNEKCLFCHAGIEEVSHSHPINFGCTICHGGDGNATDKQSAHTGLIYKKNSLGRKGNPSNLAVADKTCGLAYCHEGHYREDRNIVSRVSKSIMGSFAGVISGLRYQWAGQAKRKAKYGIYSIEDKDGWVPLESQALEKLSALPLLTGDFDNSDLRASEGNRSVSGHIGDRILRTACFSCHLDFPDQAQAPRGAGCAACHVAYGPEGRYEGDDPTIRKLKGNHPLRHKIDALPSSYTCAKCHTLYRHFLIREDAQSMEELPNLFPGSGRPIRDVHLEKGFDCIDCHTAEDVMGDGNIYSKQYQAVEIRCESCHGTISAPPIIEEVIDSNDSAVRRSRHYNGFYNVVGDRLAVSAKGRKLTNVKVMENKLITLGKISGKRFETPMTLDSQWAHSLPGHKGKLKCSACHSQWVPRCRGCHVSLDQSSSRIKSKADIPPVIWEKPVLMIGPDGKVAPMMASDPKPLTLLDELGKPLSVVGLDGEDLGEYLERPFVNPHGFSGTRLSYSVNPHSTGRNVRTCVDCHLNPKALGLGVGEFRPGRDNSGKKDIWESVALRKPELSNSADEAKVTLSGNPLAGVSQSDARMFNQEELTRIFRVGNCIVCHDSYSDKIYQNMEESYRFEKTQPHRKLRKRILSGE